MSKHLIGDDLTIDTEQRLVTQDGVELKLPELSYRLLLALVERAPNIISHDQLMTAVWQDRIVSDENLKKRVSRLRESLGDSSDSPKYFIAERGLGYRCIAPVKEAFEQPIANQLELTPGSKMEIHFRYLIAFISVLAVSVAIFLSKDSTDNENIEKLTSAGGTSFQATQFYYRFNDTDNNKAMALFKKAITADPAVSVNYSGLANVYAQGYYQFGENELWLDEALSLSKIAISKAPKKPWGHNALGFSYYLQGDYKQALIAFDTAYRIAPDWGLNQGQLALAHLAHSEYFLGYKHASDALKKMPTQAETNTIMGIVYQELSMSQHATAMYNKALKINPNYRLATANLARIAITESNKQLALKLLTKLTEKYPTHQLSHWLFAQYHLQNNNIELALTSFSKAAELGGQYQLPSKVYSAIINGNTNDLLQIGEEISTLVASGNQWPELKFNKAIIALSLNNEMASQWLTTAINDGFSTEYRLKNIPIKLTSKQQRIISSTLEELQIRNKQKQLKRAPGQ